MEVKKIYRSVSYTHLDVYKRQTQYIHDSTSLAVYYSFHSGLLRSSYQDTLFIKIKYLTLVKTLKVACKLLLSINRSSPKSIDVESSTTQAHRCV